MIENVGNYKIGISEGEIERALWCGCICDK